MPSGWKRLFRPEKKAPEIRPDAESLLICPIHAVPLSPLRKCFFCPLCKAGKHTGQYYLITCAACERLFLSTDPRFRYCPDETQYTRRMSIGRL